MYTLVLVSTSTEYHLVLVLCTSQNKSSVQVINRRAATRSPERLNLSLKCEGLEVFLPKFGEHCVHSLSGENCMYSARKHDNIWTHVLRTC
jgi:hypothetical protein